VSDDTIERIDIAFNGEVFATYRPDGSPRPHIDRLWAADGSLITRAAENEEAHAGSDDHAHHKGVWWGHRAVNGADVWTEFPNHGRISRRGEVTHVVAGAVQEIRHDSDWLGVDGDVLLSASHVIRAYEPVDGSMAIDFDVALTASNGTVTLGDTKEAGIVAVRVAPSMEERRGGRIENSLGAVGEAECWGKAAPWCDYSGDVDGTTVGIALMDHPANPRYPTFWHVRDYGLFTANPFGYDDFVGDGASDGALRIPAGQSVRFRHRLLTHAGNAHAGQVSRHYQAFIEA
jgi:Methane oxygenase PmoA